MGALRRVFSRRAGLHEKRPIARLPEQQLTRKLFQDSIRKSGRLVCMCARGFRHSMSRCVQVRIDPGICRIEPHLRVSVFSPAGSGRSDDLLGGMLAQIFAGRRELKIPLIVNRFADEEIEKAGTRKPPMAKELGVEWNYDDGIEAKGAQIGELLSPRVEKMIRMYLHHVFGPVAAIDFFVPLPASNAVIFQSGKFASGR